MWIQIKSPILSPRCAEISGVCVSYQIRDGDSMLSPMLTDLLCGHHERYDFFYPLMTFTPQSNQVMVKFVTDESDTARGFNMTWTSGQ